VDVGASDAGRRGPLRDGRDLTRVDDDSESVTPRPEMTWPRKPTEEQMT
jgi:predicted oxidoreductase